tara:strand:- start:22 stop:555 length:534 start_codon:yes stop_codon:yes gene_type:complete
MPISVSTIPSQVTQFTAAEAITAVEGEATLVLQADPTVGGSTLSAIAIAAVTLPVEATKANMEAETAGYLLVPPDLARHSPGMAKAWVHITAAGTISAPDYNVASITDTGLGNRSIVWDTDFSSVIYSCVTTAWPSANDMLVKHDSAAVGSIRLLVIAESWASNADEPTTTVAHGDQ